MRANTRIVCTRRKTPLSSDMQHTATCTSCGMCPDRLHAAQTPLPFDMRRMASRCGDMRKCPYRPHEAKNTPTLRTETGDRAFDVVRRKSYQQLTIAYYQRIESNFVLFSTMFPRLIHNFQDFSTLPVPAVHPDSLQVHRNDGRTIWPALRPPVRPPGRRNAGNFP